jgi:hypothetical protein
MREDARRPEGEGSDEPKGLNYSSLALRLDGLVSAQTVRRAFAAA